MNMQLMMARARMNHMSAGSGSDPYWAQVVSLLHFNDPDGSRAPVDSKSGSNIWTATANAAVSTEKSKFGTASLKNTTGNGTLDIANIAPMRIGSGVDFTIEMFCYPVSGSRFLDTYPSTIGTNIVFQWSGETLTFYDIGINRYTGLSLPANEWSHVALVRMGSTVTPYVNGVPGTTWTYSGDYNFGRYAFLLDVYASQATNGYIDEFRQTLGVARYVSAFSPPTEPFPNG